jgi:hypothetical protein
VSTCQERLPFLEHFDRRSSNVPTNKEFAIRMDHPGTLGNLSRVLADRGVNILAFQSNPSEGKTLVHIVTDNQTTAKTVLDNERLTYTQADVLQTRLAHRPGELARAAFRLGEANININHAYCGLEPGTNAPLLIFSVTDTSRATTILDQAAGAARG